MGGVGGFAPRDEDPVFVISVAAQLAGMHAQTLRQYDRLGLVSPSRTRGGGRRYSARDVARLREVQRLSQDEGISLAGIQRILDLENQVSALQSRVGELTVELERTRAALGAGAPGLRRRSHGRRGRRPRRPAALAQHQPLAVAGHLAPRQLSRVARCQASAAVNACSVALPKRTNRTSSSCCACSRAPHGRHGDPRHVVGAPAVDPGADRREGHRPGAQPDRLAPGWTRSTRPAGPGRSRRHGGSARRCGSPTVPAGRPRRSPPPHRPAGRAGTPCAAPPGTPPAAAGRPPGGSRRRRPRRRAAPSSPR